MIMDRMDKEALRTKFENLRNGANCPFCLHYGADRLFENPLNPMIYDFGDSALYLHRNQYWRGYCLLVSRFHVIELFDLLPEQRAQLMESLSLSAHAIELTCKPDKINYKCVGNTIPHLHWHIQPRYWKLPEGLIAMTNREASQKWISAAESQSLAAALRAKCEELVERR